MQLFFFKINIIWRVFRRVPLEPLLRWYRKITLPLTKLITHCTLWRCDISSKIILFKRIIPNSISDTSGSFLRLILQNLTNEKATSVQVHVMTCLLKWLNFLFEGSKSMYHLSSLWAYLLSHMHITNSKHLKDLLNYKHCSISAILPTGLSVVGAVKIFRNVGSHAICHLIYHRGLWEYFPSSDNLSSVKYCHTCCSWSHHDHCKRLWSPKRTPIR